MSRRAHGVPLRRLPIAHLLLDVRAVLDVLIEVADVAADFLVGLQREGNDGDEAEGEPFPRKQRQRYE